MHSMDRLALNLDDLGSIVRTLTAKGVEVCFVKEQLTFTGEDTAVANLLLSVMGVFAEFELLDPRTPTRGHRVGQGTWCLPGAQEVVERRPGGRVAPAGRRRRVPKAVLARELGVSRETLYQALHAASGSAGAGQGPSVAKPSAEVSV